MKNWKTTLFGIIGGLAVLFGPRLQGNTEAPAITVSNVLEAAAVIGLGVAAKDKNVTGGKVQQ